MYFCKGSLNIALPFKEKCRSGTRNLNYSKSDSVGVPGATILSANADQAHNGRFIKLYNS